MSERDELLAAAKAEGIKVDRRWGVEKLREAVAAVQPAPEAVPADVENPTDEPVDDGWPKQIAPQAWLDQRGRRYWDVGEALAGAEECRSG